MNEIKSSSTKTETKSDNSTKSTTPDNTAVSSADNVGKSAKESVGGAAVGHYGYFSNIKTPEYKSGWDDIWGKKKKPGGKKKSRTKVEQKPRAPIFVSLDFEDLPPEVCAVLAQAVRAQLRKKRISYDARQKKGDVDWTIDCKVRL
ncbi:MAG: hypothetical protein CFH41_01101 [Alphaproteobacteria bacterium MarineAlpha11_Bin1]|nr:MAG: hypothetical protein CFH41_01101 [Alphaproteobacteria bacterium MarineAlpha11_Bin1]|tara:strand:- start:7271 stop:7708 length:438 start_codon:yes stop_codon:yes gene_type:complete